MQADEWATVIGAATLVCGVIGGLWEYRKSQAWQRAQFAAEQMHAFFDDERVKRVLTMLDYEESVLDVDGEMRVVTDATLREALRPHTDGGPQGGTFSGVEVVVRDAFDRFLDGLEQCDHFIEGKLVKPHDFRPYLHYWLELMGDPGSRRDPAVREAFFRFAQTYRYEGALRLFRRYGYRVAVRTRRGLIAAQASSPATHPPVS